MSNTEKFTISLDGDKTGLKWHGEFESKILLSHRDELVRDARRRELLGTNAQFATDRALNQAEVLAELAVRLVKAPQFWTESNGGLDLIDDNIVGAVYKKCMDIHDAALAAVKARAEAAQAELKKNTPTLG
jgi:hypothetical protein